MGKKSRKLRSPKYRVKAAALRGTVAKLSGRGVIEIDLTTGEEITEEETVVVVTNKEPETKTTKKETIPAVEPQLQTIQIEEPKVNALKQVKAPARKTTTKTKKTATRRKRTTKKTTSAD